MTWEVGELLGRRSRILESFISLVRNSCRVAWD